MSRPVKVILFARAQIAVYVLLCQFNGAPAAMKQVGELASTMIVTMAVLYAVAAAGAALHVTLMNEKRIETPRHTFGVRLVKTTLVPVELATYMIMGWYTMAGVYFCALAVGHYCVPIVGKEVDK